MQKTKLFPVLFVILIFSQNLFSQIPVGNWRDHLSYRQAKKTAYGNYKIYCATEYAIFSYSFVDGAIERINKVNLLSDVGIVDIAFSEKHNKLIVGYENGNIDIIKNNKKINIPDIKEKNFVADKSIYHINIYKDLAYLSTGFGIVVLNLKKNEISDSYIIGENSSYLRINNTVTFNNNIYALSDNGLYFADIENPFLANFDNWEKDTLVSTNSQFLSSTVADSILYVALFHPNQEKYEVLFTPKKIQWDSLFSSSEKINSLTSYKKEVYSIQNKKITLFDSTQNKIDEIYTNSSKNACVLDRYIWIADNNLALVSINKKNKLFDYKRPNGPKNVNSFYSYYNNGEILIVPGGYHSTGVNFARWADVYSFNDEKWTNLQDINCPEIGNHIDAVTITSQQKQGHYFIGTWATGAFEVKNNEIINEYNLTNTDSCLSNQIGGMSFDDYGNLWFVCRYSDFPFVVKTTDNKWYKYDYNKVWNKKEAFKVVKAHNGDLWTVNSNIFVWNPKNTPKDPSDDDYNSFSLVDETGKSISNIIKDIEVDLEGAIWLATGDGVAVYNNPEKATQKNEIMRARRPQIVVDGYVKDLLKNEFVNCIAIDGANRKWFGTESGGVFLVNEDGTEQIINWNISNSKLFSNNVLNIEINQKTGEVFFMTDKGVLSYMGTSTKSKQDYSNIYAFPNPVEENYNGYITIRGLMYKSQIKITDLAGKLVFSTESNGGDAIWNGKDLNGNQVASGIYLVLCTTSDGEEAEATKILIVK